MANTYSTGTLAVTSGSKSVTISDGLSIAINMKPGDRIEIEGDPNPLPNAIESLTDSTHFELARAWTGATASGLLFIVSHMPMGWGDRTELNEAVAENIRLLGDAGISKANYGTRAELYADLEHSNNTLGKVYSDPTPGYNGIYKKVGRSGTGSWTRIGDLPEVDAAAASAALAARWAGDPENTQVQVGKYSALHWAAKSAASAGASQTSRLASETARDISTAARDVGITARNQSVAAAEASGPVLFYDTKALADAAVAGLATNQIVEVFNDEGRGGARTRYRKEGAVLVFKTVAGIDLDDRYLPALPQSQLTRIRDVIERGIATPAMFASNVLEPLGDYWLEDGTVNPTPRDNYDALQKAINSGRPIYLPKYRKRTGYFSSQKLVGSTGLKIRADGTMGHTTIGDGTVALVSANGEEILNLRQNNAQRCTLEGFTLFCPDLSTRGIDVTPLRTTLKDIFILGTSNGIGGVSGVFGEHSNFFNVHVYGCANIGVQRIRDTRWYGGRVAACRSDGILLASGASDNMLFLKVDFNEGWGLNINDAEDIQVFGEGFDRNYKGGIRLNSARRISGVVNLARNGRNDSGAFGEDASLYIGGTCDGVELAVMTSTGIDDNGSGTLTPRYSLHVDGANHQNINISGDLSKATVLPVRLTNGATLDQLNIQASGVPTRSFKEPTQFAGAVTAKAGLSVTGNHSVTGNQTITGDQSITRDVAVGRAAKFQSKSTGNISNAAVADLVFALPVAPAASRKNYQLRLCARKTNSFADSPSALFNLVVKRDSGDSAVEISGAFGAVDAGDTFFAISGTPGALLAPTISADGSTLTVSVTSGFAAAQINVFGELV